jgi:hypothetical protein
VSTTSPANPKRTPPSGDPTRVYGYPKSWTRPRDDGDGVERGLRAIAESLDLGEEHPVYRAIYANFTSPNEIDRNHEPANVVDGLFAVSRALHDIADAIRKRSA